MSDAKVPAAKRGTYLAFAENGDGTRAPQGSSPRRASTRCTCCRRSTSPRSRRTRPSRQTPQCDLASYAPDSTEQQECVGAVATTTPSTGATTRTTPASPTARTRSSAAAATAALASPSSARWSGPCTRTASASCSTRCSTTPPHRARATKSVLDKVVPGYYHRLNAMGDVETSTCCQNVATEHAMAREAHGRLGRDVGQGLQGRRLPLRPHGPPQQGQHAGRALGPRRADARRRTASTASPSTSTARAGTSARSRTTRSSSRPRRASSAAPASAPSTTGCATRVRGGGPFDEDPRKQGFGSG